MMSTVHARASASRLAVALTTLVSGFVCAPLIRAQAQAQIPGAVEEGIPVTDALVKSKCGTCHPSDEQGLMPRISWVRTTPEAWQETLRRMVLSHGLSLTAPEARSIVKYLSDRHGLAPEEAKPVMYEPERRIHDEVSLVSERLGDACTRCHSFARALSWRRSAADWKEEADTHIARIKAPLNPEAVSFLSKAAPLHTAEWQAWSTRAHTANLTGRWLVTASLPGRGKYYGEMHVESAGADDEFSTRVTMRSIKDGSTISRSGRVSIFGGYAWRGRSTGTRPVSVDPDDVATEAREVMWIAPDQLRGEGRWFWGQYQEFGFDVMIQRPGSGPTLLMVDRASLKAGSHANRIRLVGEHFPDRMKPGDLSFGSGVTARRIVSHSPREIVAEVDVAGDARLGARDVAYRDSLLPGAIAIYDRVDYVKVTPDSSLAGFADATHPRGYQQFEAIGYQRGADGRLYTEDDVPLGPVDVTWSLDVFYGAEGTNPNPDVAGRVSTAGLFTPASQNPNRNYDVWVIAKASRETDTDGKKLVGRSYLVITVPVYAIQGRRYVRDLDHWIEEGPANGGR